MSLAVSLAHPSWIIEVLSSRLSYKHCGPKINTLSQRYCREDVTLVYDSHDEGLQSLFLIQSVSGENVINLAAVK